MSKQLKLSIEFPSDALELLREAADDEEMWLAAVRDPLGYLAERGVALPEGHSLVLAEAAKTPSEPATMELEFNTANEPAPAHDPAPAFQPLWGGGVPLVILGDCPRGSFPIPVLETTEICVREGFIIGPKNWVPGPGGGLYGGHFAFETTRVCLQSVVVKQWKTVCATLIRVP